MRLLPIPVLFTLAATAVTVGAVDPPIADHDQARSAVASGQHLPLSEILRRVETIHPGRVLEIERDRQNGRAVYEIELLDRDGRVIEVIVDAADGRILRTDVDD